ncbi:unnamed protein product [Rotaria sordida]|uniref:Uncharacterized protein n=1 Tax=Rotaria sordida TaxID=392033 RepID=A0A814AGB8_9BILA|nr:unnamed protein product [Rotaria sordida]CAF1311924.1 unnamed protein product [Rotaria sordida]CAF3822527.1 unnamed protein product [Rotaria sordida]CAF3826538.1 unnamed protein product [Rotaria sordida]
MDNNRKVSDSTPIVPSNSIVDRDVPPQQERHHVTININNNNINFYLSGQSVENNDNDNDREDDCDDDDTSTVCFETETENQESDETDTDESIHGNVKHKVNNSSDHDHICEAPSTNNQSQSDKKNSSPPS